MNKDYKLTQMYMPLYAAFTSSCVGFLFFMFGFGAPYWLQSFSSVNSGYLHMGIWSICFDNYIHPRDYQYNRLNGCYWMFDRYFFQIGIWEWVNPKWLIAVQVLCTTAFLANISVMIILILYFLLLGQYASESTAAFFGQLFVAIIITISTCIFGFYSDSREWMQRPDHQFLAWAFGFMVLAGLCSYVAAAFLFCLSYTDRASQQEVEMFEALEGGRSTIMEGYLPSIMTGQPSQYGGKSVILGGAGSQIGGAPSTLGGVTIKVPTKGGGSEIVTLNAPVAKARYGGGDASVLSGPRIPVPGMYHASSIGGMNKPGSLIGDRQNLYAPDQGGYNRNYQRSPQSEEDMLSDPNFDLQDQRRYNR